jgi:tRNA-binding protein
VRAEGHDSTREGCCTLTPTPDPRTRGDCYGAPMIEFSDFTKVEMRVGRIVEALPFPEARNPSYRLRIDFGPELGERVSAAQLTVTYPDPAALAGRLVVAVVNLPPRRIAGFASEVLVLGAMGEGEASGEVWALEPNPRSPLGLRIG